MIRPKFLITLLLTTLATVTFSPAQRMFNATPLEDLGTGNYLGFQGGLYENGTNSVPFDHDSDGRVQAARIVPLNGKVVMLSIGMSNATDTFSAFIPLAMSSSKVNHTTLSLADGADGQATACFWTVATGNISDFCPNANGVTNEYDRVRQMVLAPAGLTENQVQAVWLYNADPYPMVHLPSPQADAFVLEGYLGGILRAARQRYPNLKIVFFSSREYGGYARGLLNPEPFAYESGFSVKWLIQAQINQIRTGQIDPIAGNLDYNSGVAPWVVWAGYTWANGPHPRSDGFFWCAGQRQAPCNGEIDVQPDGTHPDFVGSNRLAMLQLTYFLTSPYAKNWFLAQ